MRDSSDRQKLGCVLWTGSAWVRVSGVVAQIARWTTVFSPLSGSERARRSNPLQNVVIGSVVGVARMMVILRGLMRAFAFGKKRRPSCVMRALTANYWSHATDLRDNI